MKENNEKNIIKGCFAFLAYYLIYSFADLPLVLFKIDKTKLTYSTVLIYNIFIDIISILIIYFIFRKEIKKMWKDFLENKDEYFKKYFKYWFLLLGLLMLSNVIIYFITGDMSTANQDSINKFTDHSPVLMFLLATTCGPILEEFAFRLSFRKIFKDDILFILASGIMFGAFHVIPLYSNWTDLLHLVSYSIPGFIFAYIFKDSKNIFNSIGLHIFHNGLTLSLYILTKFL